MMKFLFFQTYKYIISIYSNWYTTYYFYLESLIDFKILFFYLYSTTINHCKLEITNNLNIIDNFKLNLKCLRFYKSLKDFHKFIIEKNHN